MGKYAGYVDYDNAYPGRLTEERFEQFAPSAEAYIDVITHNRAESARGYRAERVKMALCAVVSEMAAQDAAKSAGGARLQSVTNDGYTESYGVSGSGAAAETEAIRSAAFRFLSGTGLVSAL